MFRFRTLSFMTKLTALLISVIVCSFAYGQQSFIHGNVTDSSAHIQLEHAVVSVLHSKDSTLARFSRTDKIGSFSIGPLPAGDYLLLITYPKYGDYIEKVSVNGQSDASLSQVNMTPASRLLEEIIIRQQAIRIKGDTTEFTADSFYVKPNATVEELLKELPGLQVDRDGQVTAQGQRVEKVLVDGEEFFSDDPTIATRNLRADAVDKVQVFDKKSDQAEFTGIDDGSRTRTLNLKLKDNAKRGYFGKLSAAGLDKYYNAQAMINAFKGKRKLSAFGIASSTDQTGLNWQESSSYGFSASNISIDDGSGAVFISSGNDDDLDAQSYYGKGLPESIKAGIHFSNKWNEDRYNIGSNYLLNKLAERSAGNTFRKNTLEDSVYYDREAADMQNDRLRHSATGLFEWQLDSSSSIKLTASGYTGTSTTQSDYRSQALSEENKLVNSSERNLNSTGSDGSLNASILFRKKFKKKGRTLSISGEEKYNQSVKDGYIFSNADFFDFFGDITRHDTVDQWKTRDSRSNVVAAKAAYTEPLSASSFLEVNYTYSNSSSNKLAASFNRGIDMKYTDRVDSLSNDFEYLYRTNSAGLNYRYNSKKIIFSLGGNIAKTAFTQSDQVKDTSRTYDYTNFFPRANFQYKFSSFSNLSINYSGSTTQPTMEQLQPLTNNDDPLNIVTGNPSLRQQFSNNINLTYTNFQIINERYIFLGSFFTTVGDLISRSVSIDKFGRKVTRYVNTDENFSFALYGGFSMKIPKTNVRFNMRPNIYFSKTGNFINGVRNSSHNNSIGLTTGVNLSKKEKYQLNLSATPTFARSKSSISKVAHTSYWNYVFRADGNYQLPAKFEIGTDVDFNLRQRINEFDLNNNAILWNAYVEKKFLKSDALTLRVSMNDILDQNKGYSRSIQTFAIEEKNYLTFRRYGLVTLTYNFNNKGGSGAPTDASIRL